VDPYLNDVLMPETIIRLIQEETGESAENAEGIMTLGRNTLLDQVKGRRDVEKVRGRRK